MSGNLVIVEIDCRFSEDGYQRALAALPDTVVQRANRYRVEQPRFNLVASQVALRECLTFLGYDPGALATCDNGRPFLRDGDLEFNLSHSHQQAVLALSRHPLAQRALGVDVEWTARTVEREALARRFFTEMEYLACASDSETFFRIWTRKEAILKSNGIGLRVALDSFQVLDDRVEQKISGRALTLGTARRAHGYVVSWAVDALACPGPPIFVSTREAGWQDLVREGIGV